MCNITNPIELQLLEISVSCYECVHSSYVKRSIMTKIVWYWGNLSISQLVFKCKLNYHCRPIISIIHISLYKHMNVLDCEVAYPLKLKILLYPDFVQFTSPWSSHCCLYQQPGQSDHADPDTSIPSHYYAIVNSCRDLLLMPVIELL